MWPARGGRRRRLRRCSVRWRTGVRCGSCARPAPPLFGRSRARGRTCPPRGGDAVRGREVGPCPDTGRQDDLRPHEGRSGPRRCVRCRRVGSAAADRSRAFRRRGRRPHRIDGSRAGVCARFAVGDRAARRPGDPDRLPGRSAGAGRCCAPMRMVPGAARRIDLPSLRAGNPPVSRHRRRALHLW